MNIGIVGPREKGLDVPGGEWLKRECVRLVEQVAKDDPGATIISGGATGIDGLAEVTAKRLGLNTKVFLPKTGPDGKWINRGAGLARNSEIVQASEDLFAFWTGLSTGTADSIEKAWRLNVLTRVTFSNGLNWYSTDRWSPLEYGNSMKDMFSPPKIAEALKNRYERNRRNPKNQNSLEKLQYADGRTLAAFNWLIEGNLPIPGEGDDEGMWLVPSQSKKRDNIRPHRIGIDGGCDCDAVTQGHRACFAMYAVSMFLYLISPSRLETEATNE